jgi:hypothetical protein
MTTYRNRRAVQLENENLRLTVLVSTFRQDQSVKPVCIVLCEAWKGSQGQNTGRQLDGSGCFKDVCFHRHFFMAQIISF